MKSWIRQHGLALRDAAMRIVSMPGSFIFNVIVIALALMLPVAGLTLLENLQPVSRELAVEPEISVFANIDLPRERAQALAADIKRVAQTNGVVVKLDFIARENALASMKERAGLADVVSTLGSNPLPDAYVIKLANAGDAAGARRIEKLADAITRLPGVETVQLDSAWVKRLAAVLQLAENVLWLLATTLCGVVVAVVFNTIRLQVVTQGEEIDVARLLGATDAFVARPFYYTGALLGLGAGIVALLGVLLALALLNVSVGELAHLYGSTFTLTPLEPAAIAVLLAASAGLGLLGAALSVSRALTRSA
jgi:cell division transport system permease protein